MSRPESAAARRLPAWVELARPFTLLAPSLGMLSGGVAALGAIRAGHATAMGGGSTAARLLAGAAVAALLNVASNALNQVTDLDADRINKPSRPIPSGRLSSGAALRISALSYVLAMAGAAWIGVSCLAAVTGGALFTFAYSAPPLRLKRFGWIANATIAIPRGLLLTVAGWSTVASVATPDPWWLGSVTALFLLGAASTKDFADVEGDRASGCRTLAVRHGIEGTIQRIRPAFVWPFLLLAAGPWCGALTGRPVVLSALGLGLAVWGRSLSAFMAREPLRIDASGNHASWRQMYLMMLVSQLGTAAAYW